MAGANKVCRVCGKGYTACRTEKSDPSIFRWQDVACSPECGAEYLRRVIESRAQKVRKVEQRRKHEVSAPEEISEQKVQEAEEPAAVVELISDGQNETQEAQET